MTEETQGPECPDGGDCAIEQAGGSQCSYACDRPTEDDLVNVRAAQVASGSQSMDIGPIKPIMGAKLNPEWSFDFYSPDHQASYWLGPVGPHYPQGVTEARVFAEEMGLAEYLIGLEVKTGNNWLRTYTEKLVAHPDGRRSRYELAEERVQALWRYLWGLLRVAYIETTVDEVSWVRAKTVECLSKNDDGTHWLIPVPKRKEEIPGAWKNLRVNALGIREGYPLE